MQITYKFIYIIYWTTGNRILVPTVSGLLFLYLI